MNGLRVCGTEIAFSHPSSDRAQVSIGGLITSAGVFSLALRDSKGFQEHRGERVMIKKVLLCALALLVLGSYTGITHAADRTAATPSQTAPDNTGRNVRDRNGGTLTSG